jgi:hypothetical protein
VEFSFDFVAKPQCFSMTDMVTTIHGNEIPIKNLNIGDKVLAIDYKDEVIPTEVISFLHYENDSQSKIPKTRSFSFSYN